MITGPILIIRIILPKDSFKPSQTSKMELAKIDNGRKALTISQEALSLRFD